MKSSILTFLITWVALATSFSAQAQTTYTSKPGGGRWTDPNTWTVNDNNAPATPTNRLQNNGQDASNNIIIINSDVILDLDYTVCGNDGRMTVGPTGSLSDGNTPRRLFFGQQQQAAMARLELDGRMSVSSVVFYKGEADINASALLNTECNLTLQNQSQLNVEPGATLDIDGNLMVRQGNPSITGSGSLFISGCVLTNNNGSLNGLFGPSLRVCVQGQANSCDTEGMNCSPRVQDFITIDGCRTNTPLPVELTSFNAKYVNKQVQLQWATASEKNSLNFAVERSANGREFETVTTVRAAGNSTARREYTAYDRNAQSGLNYYRLKQTDNDGTFTYSQVVSVQAGAAEQQLSAYGSLEGLNVEMQTAGQCSMIRVMDSMGRVLHTETMPEGSTGQLTRQIPLRQSQSGVYIVQAVTSTGTMSKKFYLQ